MENNNGKIIITLLGGVAAGIGLGMLYAPRKGTKTRRRMRHSVIGTTYDVSKKLKRAKKELTKTANKKKEDFDKKLDETISNMSYKAEDIITSLEAKLEDLKKKNEQLQK